MAFYFMYKVYALFSEKFNKIYIGFTTDMELRMKYHNEISEKGWTHSFRPWKLIYFEEFQNKQEALKREKQLKSFRGREFIRNLIK